MAIGPPDRLHGRVGIHPMQVGAARQKCWVRASGMPIGQRYRSGQPERFSIPTQLLDAIGLVTAGKTQRKPDHNGLPNTTNLQHKDDRQ